MNEQRQVIGYLAEDESKISSVVTRQLLRSHRNFKATVLDTSGNIVLEINRPAYLVSTSLFVHLPNQPEPLGDVHMQWHLMRRKYNLYLNKAQFAEIDEQALQWDFHLKDSDGRLLGTINRNWIGLAKEVRRKLCCYPCRFSLAANYCIIYTMLSLKNCYHLTF